MPAAIHKANSQAHNKIRTSKIESARSADDHSFPIKSCALDDFLSRPEFCRRYRISLRTAEMMAHKGKGPKVTHLGKRAYYHVEDIAAWCDAERAKSKARFESQGDV